MGQSRDWAHGDWSKMSMLPVAPKTSCKVTGLGSKSATGRLGTFWTLDQPSVTSIQMMRIAVTSHEDHEAWGVKSCQVMSSLRRRLRFWDFCRSSLGRPHRWLGQTWPNSPEFLWVPMVRRCTSLKGVMVEGQLNGTRKLPGKRCPRRFNSLWYLMAGSLFGIKNTNGNGNWVIKLILCFWCQWARLLDLILPTFGCCTPRSKANADILSHRSSLVVLCFSYSTIASYVPHPGIGKVWRFTLSTYFLVGSSQIATRVFDTQPNSADDRSTYKVNNVRMTSNSHRTSSSRSIANGFLVYVKGAKRGSLEVAKQFKINTFPTVEHKVNIKVVRPKKVDAGVGDVLSMSGPFFLRCFLKFCHGLVEVSSRLVDIWWYSSHFEPCNLKDTPFTIQTIPDPPFARLLVLRTVSSAIWAIAWNTVSPWYIESFGT